jgi:pathogenesis-related protein 1
MNKIKELIKNNPETAFLACFGLLRDIIGYAAIFFMIAAAGYTYNKKISETQDMVRATAEDIAVTLMQVDALVNQADNMLGQAAGAVHEVKKISPSGVKTFIDQSISRPKKLKIVPAPVPIPAKEIPGLAVEGDLQLLQINEWRSKLGLPPLQQSKELVTASMDRAIDLANTCTLSPSNRNKKYVENLYLGWQSGDGAVAAWAEEREYYNARDGSCQSGKVCDHWTQMMRREAKAGGCAWARCLNGRVVVACSFSPRKVGEKAY